MEGRKDISEEDLEALLIIKKKIYLNLIIKKFELFFDI